MFNKAAFRTCLLSLFLVIIMMTSGCENANEIKVGSDANGQKITLQRSGDLAVRLESNPTTGFRWELTECDKSVLAPQGEPQYEAASQNQKVAGGGGWETFQFKPQKAGQTHLKLVYHRIFEKGVEPARTFDLEVVVE